MICDEVDAFLDTLGIVNLKCITINLCDILNECLMNAINLGS